jgi:hypothetical protein
VHLNRHLRGRRAAKDSIFGKFQEASKKLKAMITLSPDSPEPYHLLGTMHEELGKTFLT